MPNTRLLRLILAVFVATNLLIAAPSPTIAQNPPIALPAPADVQAVARRVNDYWIANRPGAEDNNWSRGTYFTGNMAHYAMSQDERYLDNAWQWAEDFNWQLNGGCSTVYAENHTAAQTYLALYEIDPRRADISCVISAMNTSANWGWLEVDLGETVAINRLSLTTFQDRAYRYLVDVKTSVDEPYTLLLDRADGMTGEATFAPTPARFLRVRVIGADGYNGLRVSLNELQIYAEDAPTNLAHNRPVTCSSVAELENGCANGVDGNPDTAWSALIREDFSVESPKWWWVDALYVAMPVYAVLSNLEEAGMRPETPGYSAALYAKYDETKVQRGLWDEDAALWVRDLRFVGMRSPNDQPIFWSRGNGWAFAALARVLDILPPTDPYYQEYLMTFQAMAQALIAAQDDAGFWHQNLADANHCGGPESSGTAFFAYGLAWGINHEYLDRATYLPATVKAWTWLAESAVQDDPDGLFGYVQPIGDAPICDTHTPLPGPTTTADFGVGAFLLAASEVVKLETSGVFESAQFLPFVRP